MRHSIPLILMIFLVFSCKDDDSQRVDVSEDKLTFIWQGFYHDWTYNHRVNRMGDWISDVNYTNGFKGNFIHSAASGIGADDCSFTTFTTAVKTGADIDFRSGTAMLIIQGQEGSAGGTTAGVQVIFEDRDYDEAEIFLNGFDMFSRPQGSPYLVGDGQADKLWKLDLEFINVRQEYDGQNTIVNFDVSVAVGADCASPECSSGELNDWFDYEVTVGYQVIAGNTGVLSISDVGHPTNEYDWERPMDAGANEIFREDYTLADLEVQGEAGYAIGVNGITSLSFEAQKGFGGFDGNSFQYPHMLNFDFALYDQSYDPNSGKMNYTADLFFKNWTAPVPPVSFGAGGSMMMSMETKLIQIDDPGGIVESGEYSGSITWLTNPFNPAPPTNSASLNVVPVDLVVE